MPIIFPEEATLVVIFGSPNRGSRNRVNGAPCPAKDMSIFCSLDPVNETLF